MKNNNKLKIFSLAIVAIGGYLVIKNILKAKSEQPAQEPSVPNTPLPSTQAIGEYPLKKGSKGAAVRQLQNTLIQIDSNALPKYGVDGDFGSETEAAVYKYLKKTSVDSFIDMQGLQAIAESQSQKNVDETRQLLASNMVNDWNNNKTMNFYAKSDTTYQSGDLSFIGLEMNDTSVIAKTGTLIVSGASIQKLTILPSGFLKATTMEGNYGKYYKMSPFSVIYK